MVLLAAVLVLAASTTTAVARLAGPDVRFAFVARGDNPIDALGAAPVAGRLDAPVLLTPPTTLSDAARQGLVDQAPEVVVIAGGPAAVSTEVEQAIGQAVPEAQVRRVAGQDRYLTAAALASLVREYEPAFAYTGRASGEDTNAYGIACPSGQVLTGISGDGEPMCVTDTADGGDAQTLDGLDSSQFVRTGDHVPTGQGCAPGLVVTGIAADGSLVCATDDVDGGNAGMLNGKLASDFALSNQACAVGRVVTGISRRGDVTCGTADGGDANLLDGLDSTDFVRTGATAHVAVSYATPSGDAPDTIRLAGAGAYRTGAGTQSLNFPVQLPAGARLMRLEAAFRDQSAPTDIEVALAKRSITRPGSPTVSIASVQTTDMPGYTTVGVDLTRGLVSSTTAYWLAVRPVGGTWDGTDLTFVGATIEVELP